jgi:hypothetical protein
MKNYLVVGFFILAFWGTVQAQDQIDVRNGFKQYRLGTSRTHLGTLRAIPGGELTFKGVTEKSYTSDSLFADPMVFGGVALPTVLLTFVSDTLTLVELSRLYNEKLSGNYRKKAKADFKKLYRLVKNKWASKGERKTFHNYGTLQEKRFEWIAGNKIMWLRLVRDKQRLNPHCFVFFSIQYMPHY